MLDRLEFMLTEAFVALRRNLLMTFAAISTAAVALFLLGGLAYVYLRVNQFASDVSDRFEMRVWLKDPVTEAQAKAMGPKIEKLKGVKEAIFVPKASEWAKFRTNLPEITKGMEENPLPHSYRVTLSDLGEAEPVKAALAKLPESAQVIYLKDEQELLDQLMAMLRWVGGALGSLLLVTAGILIFNAIKLTILARRREIRIMQLVGASKQTVRTPFMIEGAVQGAVGGMFAAVLIQIAQAGIQRLVEQVMVGVILPPFPLGWAMLILAAVGGGFGTICSFLAIREPLRYRSGVTV